MGVLSGKRSSHLAPFLDEGAFLLTWEDGICDINLRGLLVFHRSHGKLVAVTAVRQSAGFGHLLFEGDRMVEFSEKSQIGEGLNNSAFFVIDPAVFDYIQGDDTLWEREPIEQPAADWQPRSYMHTSYWQCIDTLLKSISWRNYGKTVMCLRHSGEVRCAYL